MDAIIRDIRFGMSYDCVMVESVAKLNKSKSAKLALYAYYEETDLVQRLKDMRLGEAGEIIICKSDRYFWLLEDSKILNISRQYLERYIRVKIEVSYSKAIGTTSMQLIKRNAALKKILDDFDCE